MNLKTLLFNNQSNPEKSLAIIKKLCYIQSKNKILLFSNKRLGKLSISDILNSYSKTLIINKIIDINPIDIIGSRDDCKFCDIPIIDLLFGDEKVRYLNFFSKHSKFNSEYFFEKINEIDGGEMISCISFNTLDNKLKYIILHGHHRLIIAIFLQMIDKNYRLKGILVKEHYQINWSKIQYSNKVISFFNQKKYFNYYDFISKYIQK